MKTSSRKMPARSATRARTAAPQARRAAPRLPAAVNAAIHAAQDRKATDVVVLNLKKSSAFTDYFVLCTGQNVRQVTAIADAVEEALKRLGLRPAHIEGYDRAEWVLLDYFDIIVHVFTPATREFYALDRLWGQAERIEIPNPEDAKRA